MEICNGTIIIFLIHNSNLLCSVLIFFLTNSYISDEFINKSEMILYITKQLSLI